MGTDSATTRLRICIATSDLIGPIRNGGIGTACSALAQALAGAGHDVTLLYVLGDYCETRKIDHWIREYARQGISLVPLPRPSFLVEAPWGLLKAYETYLWLKEQEFSVIHFHEWRGHGYFCVLAKHQGLAFAATRLVITAHSPGIWHRMGSGEAVDALEQLEFDFMERTSVALADELVSPSRYMLAWMQEQRWVLPQRTCVRQNILPRTARTLHAPKASQGITEVVFFGRLESRKGLALFCDALDLLTGLNPPAFRVTFLGKEGRIDGQKAHRYLKRRARKWPMAWKLVGDLDHLAAVCFLAEGGRLAVMPSLIDNSPYTVLECLAAGIPFLASRVGGAPELIHPDDVAHATFPPEAGKLVVLLIAALRQGMHPVRPAQSPEQSEAQWVAWHALLAEDLPAAAAATETQAPLVSVCMTHYNRSWLLTRAVESIEAQDYANVELILVDDGSTQPDALSVLDQLEPRFAAHGWRIIRQENRYLGAARNAAASVARGEFLLFMDDDNYAMPHEVSTFVRAARSSRADILTCVMDVISGEGALGGLQAPVARWVPLGGAASVGAFRNCFGDANALVRRDVFLALGGFTEDHGLGHEDWEFFARAVLKGYRLEVMPEPVYWYRFAPGSMLRSTQRQANIVRSLRPYLEAVPEPLRGMVLLAQGLYGGPADDFGRRIWRRLMQAGFTRLLILVRSPAAFRFRPLRWLRARLRAML